MALWQISGWQIESDLQFPDLNHVATSGENVVRVISKENLTFVRDTLVQESLNEDGSKWFSVYKDKDAYFVEYREQLVFQIISDRNLISYIKNHEIPNSHFRHLLLDQIFPLFLSTKGYLLLHVSAVAAKKGAILFSGKSGSGKSTLVANLSSEFRFISDDFVALNSELILYPTYPVIRLWEEPKTKCCNFNKISSGKEGDKLRLKVDGQNYIEKEYSPIAFIELSRDCSIAKGKFILEEIDITVAFKSILNSLFIVDPTDVDLQKYIFAQCSALLSQISLFRLSFSDLDGDVNILSKEINNLWASIV